MERDEILTVPEAAKEMAMHTSTISNWCNQGVIKGIKVKGSWRIKRADLEEFKEHRANGHIPQGTRFVESPQPDRPELSDRVKKIHADAAQMVWDRQDILAKLFPHPQPGEIYDYVLHNMAPSGLSKMPSLEELMQATVTTEEEEMITEKDPEKEFDGELGAKLARAENEMKKLMEHPKESVRTVAIHLYNRIQKVKADNRKIIEDYVRKQEEKGDT